MCGRSTASPPHLTPPHCHSPAGPCASATDDQRSPVFSRSSLFTSRQGLLYPRTPFTLSPSSRVPRPLAMATSSKKKVSGRLRSQQFDQNINKRGKVVKAEKVEKSPFGPVVIGFFLFVVVGSGPPSTRTHTEAERVPHPPQCNDLCILMHLRFPSCPLSCSPVPDHPHCADSRLELRRGRLPPPPSSRLGRHQVPAPDVARSLLQRCLAAAAIHTDSTPSASHQPPLHSRPPLLTALAAVRRSTSVMKVPRCAATAPPRRPTRQWLLLVTACNHPLLLFAAGWGEVAGDVGGSC